jgi:hypothetical protein
VGLSRLAFVDRLSWSVEVVDAPWNPRHERVVKFGSHASTRKVISHNYVRRSLEDGLNNGGVSMPHTHFLGLARTASCPSPHPGQLLADFSGPHLAIGVELNSVDSSRVRGGYTSGERSESCIERFRLAVNGTRHDELHPRNVTDICLVRRGSFGEVSDQRCPCGWPDTSHPLDEDHIRNAGFEVDPQAEYGKCYGCHRYVRRPASGSREWRYVSPGGGATPTDPPLSSAGSATPDTTIEVTADKVKGLPSPGTVGSPPDEQGL